MEFMNHGVLSQGQNLYRPELVVAVAAGQSPQVAEPVNPPPSPPPPVGPTWVQDLVSTTVAVAVVVVVVIGPFRVMVLVNVNVEVIGPGPGRVIVRVCV